jgi:hypothetical protein
MKEIIDFILKNKEWIFSGIGVVLAVGFIKLILLFFKRRNLHREPSQSQDTHGSSTAYQAGRDIIIGAPQPGMTRSLRLRVHRAFFVNNLVPHYFINVVNTSDAAEVEVTHVWYEGSRRVDIMQAQRPLPRLLRPTQSWETWIRVIDIPDDPDPFRNFRVRLSTDEVFESEENLSVPPQGFVPGG